MENSKFKYLTITFPNVETKNKAITESQKSNISELPLRFGFSFFNKPEVFYLLTIKTKSAFEAMAEEGLCTIEEISAQDFNYLDPRNKGNEPFVWYGEIQYSPWKNMKYSVKHYGGIL